MLIVTYGDDYLEQFILNVKGDISTAVTTGITYNFAADEYNSSDICLGNNYTTLYMSGLQADTILEFNLHGTVEATLKPYLATTRTYDDLIDATGSQDVQTKVTLKAEGDKMTSLQATLNKKGYA